MNRWIILPIVSLIVVSSQIVHAEIKQFGTVLEYACALNQSVDSQYQKICFASVVGDQGQFVTTTDQNGLTRAWRVFSSVRPTQIGKGGGSFERLQLQQIGIVNDGNLEQTINTEVLVGELLKWTNQQAQVISVDGQIQGQQVKANEFQTFSFTMDTGAQDL